MATALPTVPAPASVTPRYRAFGNDLTPPLGGPVTRIRRLGDRWSVDVQMPPMDYADEAMLWISRLIRRADTVTLPFPQPGFGTGTPGAPRVNGSGQLGMSLVLDGFTPAYVMREGQFFSIVSGGQRFLYSTTGPTTANGSGQMTLPFEPMLRRQPADNDVVEVALPVVEGFIEGRETSWTIKAAYDVGLSFTIAERE